MSQEIELRPCPMCGKSAFMYDTGDHYPKTFYRVITPNCNCCMQARFYETPEEAAADWNRRVWYND